MTVGKCSIACITASSAIIFTSVFSPASDAVETESAPVYFENSCSAEVQADFSHAVTLLHSFEYLESPRFFNKVIAGDADCAMARWGVAMTLWHPLWAPPGQANLEAGARLLAETDSLPKTPREAVYIEALKAFYSSTDVTTHNERAQAYEERMSRIYADHLDDPEAALFYALSLLATADPRDKSYSHQYKAAGILNWVQNSQPTHRGVLHYLIHSYDYPGLAHLALNAATIYAEAAPDSAHAQHMPSHIFTRLGLWNRSLASNHDSTKSAADYTIRANLPGHYDEGLHSIDYLMYAMLQTARDDAAADLLAKLRAIEKTDTENFKVAFAYAASPARYALERRAWKEASELTFIRPDFPWDQFGWAQAIHHFARGIGAARSNQIEKARVELERLHELQEALPGTTLKYWQEEAFVEIDAVRSWILLAEGKRDVALRLSLAAAEREDAVDKHPVTPGEVLPARELYADMLSETGNHAKALEQYRIVLKSSPNRLNALLGAARSAAQAGDMESAEAYEQIVRGQTASGTRPGMKFR